MKNKNKVIIIIQAILLIVVSVLLIVVSIAYKSEKATSDMFTEVVMDYSKDADASEYKGDFIEGCTEAGGRDEDCDCIYNYVAKRMTGSEIMEMSLDIAINEEISDILYDAVDNCM